ncbi:unnamed protein product, partial [Rotaria sordida]
YYFIHRETSINILNELINYAIVTTHYTLDTEDQLQPRRKLSKDHVEIYASPEILTLNDDNTHGEPMGNILTGVYGQDEPYEMVSDDDLDYFSLPEI